MENASKALIIAGAILISIVLVSVGVIVVQSLNPEEALSQMDQESVDAFNSKFVNSAGSNVRGTVVKTLVQNVITSNANNEASKQISVVFTNPSTDSALVGKKTTAKTASVLSKVSNSINTSHTYTVLLTYNTDNGIVKSITITDNNG